MLLLHQILIAHGLLIQYHKGTGRNFLHTANMETSPPTRKLIMIGACYVDTILTVPHYPQPDEKLRATDFEKRRGGNVANALEVMAQFPESSRHRIQLFMISVLPARSSPATAFIEASRANRDRDPEIPV
jgi:ketohexokinase